MKLLKIKRLATGILAAALAFSLTACSSGTSESTAPSSPETAATKPSTTAEAAEPSEDRIYRQIDGQILDAIDPAACEPSYKSYLGNAYADYQALMQAVMNRTPEVTVNADYAESMIAHMQAGPYGVFAETAVADHGKITLTFRYNENDQADKKKVLDDFFLELVNKNVSPEDNELERLLALYQAVSDIKANATYFGDINEVPSVLDAIESGDSQSSQYAEIFVFCLHLLNMEAYPVIASADEYPEVLACASVDGTFYYFDPFYDAMATNGRGLMGFGMVIDDLLGYLSDSTTKLWNAQGDASFATPNLLEPQFNEFRTVTFWNWGEDPHTIALTNAQDQTWIYHTDTQTSDELSDEAKLSNSLDQLYPVFDSIIRAESESDLSYDASNPQFIWETLYRLSCNYGYFFEGVSYEKEGFVTVSAAAMEEMADRCFGSGVSLSLPDDFSSVSIQEDGSYLMSLSDMSENTIRIGNATIAGDTLQVSVSYLQPSESDGDTPGESRLLAEYQFLCTASQNTAGWSVQTVSSSVRQ